LLSTLQAVARDCVAFVPAPPPLPASFEALCDVVERVEGVCFRKLVEHLPRRVPTGSGHFNLRLWNETDQLLATQVVQIPETGPTQIRWRGLLALDEYLEVEQGRGRSVDALMIELGEVLTQQVLGEPLMAHLFQRQHLGTLFVELPTERRPEALELMRIPWELTRYRGKWLADAGLECNIPVDKLAPCLYM
jgi:hypothetical protein